MAHLPFARSLPLDELQARLAELPRDKPVLAYCRGPFCFMSANAVSLLHEQAMRYGCCATAWPNGGIRISGLM